MRLIILIATFLLTSCATAPQTSSYTRYIPWSKRQHSLQSITRWQIKAAVGIRTPQKSETANLHWQQRQRRYRLSISGPLGFGSTRIVGQPGHITLWKSTKEKYSAKSPEALMRQQIGWSLPISNLYYWVRGLAVPHIKSKAQLDHYGRIATLQQQNWRITYSHYTTTKGIDLPSRIRLQTRNLLIKLVIQSWLI